MRLPLALALTGCVVALGCTSDAERSGSPSGAGGAGLVQAGSGGATAQAGSGGMPAGGAAPSSGGAPSMGAGGVIAPGSGGSIAAGASSTGGVPSASGGAEAAGGASPATGGTTGSGGAIVSGPDLRVYGNTTTLELAPALLAATGIYPGKAPVTNGGIPNLWTPGQADLATNAETQALRQSVTHPNLRIIFTVCEGFYRIVARRSASISSLADLRGKRIGTIPSTSSAYYLHKMLGTVSLTESDVTIVPLAAPASISTGLSSRQMDAATVWEPEIQRAEDALGTDAIELFDRTVYRELFNLHTTAELLADPAKRRGIVLYVKALMTASQQIRDRPDSVYPLVAMTTGYDQALVSKVWKYEGFAGTLVSDLLDVLTEEEVWVAKDSARQPRARADLATLIDTSVLADAQAMP